MHFIHSFFLDYSKPLDKLTVKFPVKGSRKSFQYVLHLHSLHLYALYLIYSLGCVKGFSLKTKGKIFFWVCTL